MFFNPVPILISAVGVLLLIKIRAFFIFHPIKTAKLCIKTVSGKGSFLSLSLALAGTLGVGNVLVVAVGLILGGAGSVFWLFTSVIFASALKYSEVVVCSKYSYSGFGMIGAVRESMPRAGGFLSVLYALAALFVALVMGAALQSGTVAECLDLAHSVPSLATSVVLVALVIFAASGGGDIIEKITAVIIPLTTVLYVVLTLRKSIAIV